MLNKLKPTIAIIDSGIGGISVLNQLIKRYNAGNYIYFADNLNMPYGNMSKLKLKTRLLEIFNILKPYNVDAVIIACNTASSVLTNCELENVFLLGFNKNETYLATPLTKKSLPNYNVISDCSLAKQIEENIFDKAKINKLIKEHAKNLKLNKLKNLVLACTHYELAEECFKKHCPNTEIVCNSAKLIEKFNIDFNQNDTTIHFILSKPNINYLKKLQALVKQ